MTGTAKDNVAVDSVYYELNGGGWTLAATTNDWTNWTASATLTPGANSLRSYAVDASGNLSLTNTVKFTYVLYAPLTVQWTGQGTVSPGYGGKLLQVGKSYTMTATPARGFAFTGWTGSQPATTARLTFQMNSNLAFTANFADVQRPVLVILSPKANQNVSTAALTVSGKAGDNVGVVSVFYQLNGAGWNLATTANNWTNWTADVTLAPGLNTLQACAVDAAGNASLTNTVKCTYSTGGAGDLAPSSVSGLSAVVSSPGASPFTLSLGADTFSVSMLPGNSAKQNMVGTCTYTKLGANTGMLAPVFTGPPSRVGQQPNPVMLTFTASNKAAWAQTNQDGTVDHGTITFSQARNTAPGSLAGDTLHSTYSGVHSTVVFGTDTATVTGHSGNVSSSSYIYTQYSPVGGMVVATQTSPAAQAGSVVYVVFTFSSASAGSFYQESYDASGTETGTTSGTFTMQ